MKIKYILFVVFLFSCQSLMAKDKVFELTTAVSGVVDKVLIKPGQKVKKGKSLLLLDQRVFKAKLEAAEKTLKSAELELAEAEKEQERAEELYERTVLSDHQLNEAKVLFAKAQAWAAQAKRELAEAQYNMDYSQISAPFDLKIKKLHAWPGQVVNNREKNTVLITVVKQ